MVCKSKGSLNMNKRIVCLVILSSVVNMVSAKPLNDISQMKTSLFGKQEEGSLASTYKYECTEDNLKWYVPGEIIVKLKDSSKLEGIKTNLRSRTNSRTLSYNKVFNVDHKPQIQTKSKLKNSSFNPDLVYLVTLKDISHKYLKKDIVETNDCLEILSLIEELKADENVEYAEPNTIKELFKSVNDPLYNPSTIASNPTNTLWGLNKIEISRAWDLSTGEGVKVAVIDSGIDYFHPDLLSNITTFGLDYVNNDSIPEDLNGHGTHVAGTIAAVGDNNRGMVGVAYKAELLPSRVLDSGGAAITLTSTAIAIYDAVNSGANVINLSLGGRLKTSLDEQVCQYAYDNDVVVVAAAGNEGLNSFRYPAAFNTVISVGNSNIEDVLEDDSMYGSWVWLAAPGNDIISTFSLNAYSSCTSDYCIGQDGLVDRDDSTYGYALARGTSMSSPHVAGLAALLRSYSKEFSVSDIFSIMYYTTDDMRGGNSIGGGRINAGDALATAQIVKSSWAVDADKDGAITNIELANYLWELRKTAKTYNEKQDVNNDSRITFADDQIIFDIAIVPNGEELINLYYSYYAVFNVVDKKFDGSLTKKESKLFKRQYKKIVKSGKYHSKFDVNFDGVVNSRDGQLIATVFNYVGISL